MTNFLGHGWLLLHCLLLSRTQGLFRLYQGDNSLMDPRTFRVWISTCEGHVVYIWISFLVEVDLRWGCRKNILEFALLMLSLNVLRCCIADVFVVFLFGFFKLVCNCKYLSRGFIMMHFMENWAWMRIISNKLRLVQQKLLRYGPPTIDLWLLYNCA